MKLYRRDHADFPSKGTVASHFKSRANLLAALARRAEQTDELLDIAGMLASLKRDQPGAQFAPVWGRG